MDRMTNDKISERQFILAVCLIIFGCILLLSGFIVNPTGVIHGSVLAASEKSALWSGPSSESTMHRIRRLKR